MHVLVTGGAGYIGSHTVRELKKDKFNPIIFDNLSNGHRDAVKGSKLIKGDLLDQPKVIRALQENRIDAIIHFAGFIEVGESVKDPQKYYLNNVLGSLSLFGAAKEAKVKKIVFSSSAAVYGNPRRVPIQETDLKEPTNPYGQTKLMVEKILQDYDKAYNIKSVSLRYFNAAGADISGQIGESHSPETHLIPIIISNLLKKKGQIKVNGNDYKTKDGTCVRDYIHVTDLARAHVLALKFLNKTKKTENFNLGTAKGFSIMEVIKVAKKVTGEKVKYRIGPRREGDPDILVASNSKARKELGWQIKDSSLENIIRSAWQWHKNNLKGFAE